MRRTIALSVVVSAVLSVALTLATVGLLAPGRAGAQSAVSQAAEFQVVDEAGNVRASLSAVSGIGSLTLRDGAGNVRITIYGDGLVTLADTNGQPRMQLSVDSSGRPVVALSDKGGEVRAAVREGLDGTAGLVVWGKDGHVVQTVP